MNAEVPLSSVRVRRETLSLPTYEPYPPDKNPMFLEKRVYQGSSGRVYPLPVYDRIAEEKTDHSWDAIWIENEFLEVLILPEIGGRIHAAKDKTNGYNIFYRQDVIKPALVGLAGPWISGGVEFNWPQHHRPATFMRTDVEIERHPDGAITVWCSDHDPMCRMKGMHGVCLHPGRAYIELKVRLYNRTQLTQSFLWWANAATQVHNAYQSFFPPDVSYVADHARRSMSSYPLCSGRYYGVDYEARGQHGIPAREIPSNHRPPHCGGNSVINYAPNNLSFYANIPVPTSYMCMGSREDFFGGYDHRAQAGVVHVANHHIAPGKKQWTWGNHDFGYAWDRNLTDPDEHGDFPPYIELMAGVYTDNQPDFSFLMPGETRIWSQFWYPIQKIGPVQHANSDAAISLQIDGAEFTVGVCVTSPLPEASVELTTGDRRMSQFEVDLVPGKPSVKHFKLPENVSPTQLGVRVIAQDGRVVLAYRPQPPRKTEIPPAATEPAAPKEIASNEELYLTGVHLEQYRHATRDPLPYWREALRRDPGDARCNNAIGLWHLQRGEFKPAEVHFAAAIDRLTKRNANPRDGEPYYNLGLTLRYLGRDDDAYSAFYKATWNMQWQPAAFHALAELDCRRQDWSAALDHLDRAIRVNHDNLNARDLRVIVLRKLGQTAQAADELRKTRAIDPLHWWTRHLSGETISCDTQTRLDISLDFVRAGFLREAVELLLAIGVEKDVGTAPLADYYLAWLYGLLKNDETAIMHCRLAAEASPDYCFPARIEEIAILEDAIRRNRDDNRAAYYLGNLLYDRKRQREAITLWNSVTLRDKTFPTVWRNLGVGYFNVSKKPMKASMAYDSAFLANPSDARILYERDQLWKQVGVDPEKRLREIEDHRSLALSRDDMAVELCALYNQTGQHAKALAVISTRQFQPWEGGEGLALNQHIRTHLALGREALAKDTALLARKHFEQALCAPENLHETNHLLANRSDVHYWLGVALDELGHKKSAALHWRIAAEFRGDFQAMSVCPFSEMTYYSAISLRKLGDEEAALSLLNALLAYAREQADTEAKIDYFATSLPTMLLFDDDIQLRRVTASRFLEAQALLGLGFEGEARDKLHAVLTQDPNHPLAEDFLKLIDSPNPKNLDPSS